MSGNQLSNNQPGRCNGRPSYTSKKMAYLTKQQYEYRAESAARKMQKNAEIETLTAEQHEALADLCRIRHEFHCNLDHIARSDEQGYKHKLVKANRALLAVGLPLMEFIPYHDGDYIDIDSIAELYEMEDVPEDAEEHDEWFSDNYYRIMDELSELHSKIEDYLGNIDQEHGTQYCPSGALRIF